MIKDSITTSNSVNSPRIEIKTLAGQVCENSDKILQTLMNEGWELMCPPILSTVVIGNVAEHFEIVKLTRLVGDDEDPEEDEETEEVKPQPQVDVRPPMMPFVSGEVVRGTVLGLDMPTVDVERKPVEEVSYTEALVSGRYSGEEIKQIGNREAAQAGMNALWKAQQWGERRWTGLVNTLPTPHVIGDVVNL
jgi:hypothetical protein